MIKVENLCKKYGNLSVLENINTEIHKGEVISVIGPSGCGKSTFIRCLNLLEQPTSGKIYIDGEDIMAKNADVSRLRRKMGMVFQSYNLFSHLMIIENIMLGPVNLLKTDRQTAYEEGMKLLEMVGLGSKAFTYPDELSGGQRQRAAIARTLAMKPEIVLFDEPTAALDPRMVSEVLSVIKRLAADGMTMIIVTHEMNFAKNVSSRVFYMDEKNIYEDASPEIIFGNPQKPKTKDFIFKIHTYSQKINSEEFDPYACWAGIENFLKSQFLPEKKIRSALLVCEEIIYNILFPSLGDGDSKIDFTLKYSEQKENIELTFAPDKTDIIKNKISENDISMKIIQGYTKEFSCENGILSAIL